MGSLSVEVRTEVLCGRICDLEAENAKLRETLQRRTEQFEGMCEMWVERGVENAKLRELVRDMWIEGMCECGSLGKCESCIYDYPSRMRELGIEVDE